MVGGKMIWVNAFFECISVKRNTTSLAQDLNSTRHIHILPVVKGMGKYIALSYSEYDKFGDLIYGISTQEGYLMLQKLHWIYLKWMQLVVKGFFKTE